MEVALSASGTVARPVAVAGATVTLNRADVAFGPAYFCASASATTELCSVAIAELRDVVVVRALDPALQSLGALHAVTGTIHSAIYDYGISWPLTQHGTRRAVNAPGGHSAILEGSLERAGRTLRFTALIDVTPGKRGQLTVNTQRTEHELRAPGEQLTLTVDPNRWVDRLEPDALFALDEDGDGAVVILKESTSYESILQGMLNRAPIGFRWN